MSFNHADANDPAHTWTISTPLAGLTVTTLMVVSTASAVPLVGVFMPTTGGRKFMVKRAVAMQTTGTVVNFIWGAANAPAMTAAAGGAAGIRHSTMQSATNIHAGRFFNGSQAMVGTALTMRPLGGAIAGATAAGVVTTFDENLTDDPIVVNAGNFIGLFADVVGGVVRASLTITEIPE